MYYLIQTSIIMTNYKNNQPMAFTGNVDLRQRVSQKTFIETGN